MRCDAHLFGLLLTACFCVEPLLASDALGPNAPGVLVLRNGEILTGNVTKAGDRYVVAQTHGGEVRIPTQHVEMCCLDLEEAYVRKRERISARDASARLQLADWCLRSGLHARAADELLAAQTLSPHDPRIRGLERRLQSAIKIGQPSDADPLGAPPLARCPDASTPLCRLPNEAVEGFASRVQPLLLNRCGASPCHGARSPSDFQLIFPGWGKTITQKYTQRNLAAVLQQLDVAHPEASPLLTVPTKPHAGLPTPVFGSRDQPQFDLLSAWVRTAGQTAQQPASLGGTRGRLLQTSLTQPVPLPAVSEVSSGTETQLATAALSGGSSRGEPAATLDFRDPFDPERFNRRFLGAAAPAATTPPASAPETPGCSTRAEARPSIQKP